VTHPRQDREVRADRQDPERGNHLTEE
jgi:hypothetical protein